MSEQSQGPGWWQASDGKWYPPAPAPDAAPPPPAGQSAPPSQFAQAAPPAEKKGMSGCLTGGLIALVVFAVLGVGCAAILANSADDASKDIAKQDADKLNDAKIVDCTTDDVGYMAATVEITNNSAERSNYDVTVTYTSPDGSEQFATGSASALALAPGQKRTEPAQSLETPTGEFKCDITDVFRFSDE